MTAVRKACRIAKKLRELGVRPLRDRPHRLSCRRGRLGEGSEGQYEENRRDVSRSRRRSRRITASASRPKAKFAGAACTPGKMIDLLEQSASPKCRLPGRHGAHALYTLGYNEPKHRIVPEKFDWEPKFSTMPCRR